jgi:hypothetical protein
VPGGVAGYIQIPSDPIVLGSGESGGEAVVCPPGTVVLGGGILWTQTDGSADLQDVQIESTGPYGNNQWVGRARNYCPGTSEFVVTAICATVAPD